MSSEQREVLDPHVVKLIDRDYPYMDKSAVVGHLNCIIDARSGNRQLGLTAHLSRAVLKHQIHELILTDEPDAGRGKVVNRVAYLAFFEVDEGGMILVGDRVDVDGQELGRVAGFDLTHGDNHINICIKVPEPARSGYEMGCKVGAGISFSFASPDQQPMR